MGEGVTGVSVGDHVILTFASCGACGFCAQGKPAYCMHFARLNSGGLATTDDAAHTQDGRPVRGGFLDVSFASHAIASPANAVVVPPDLDLATIAPLGCAIQTGAGSMLNILRPSTGSSVLVMGLGGVGMAA